MVKFTVPEKPVSLNRAYPTGSNGRRFLTQQGKDYKARIAMEAVLSMKGKTMTSGPVEAGITFYFGSNVRRDVDNFAKLCLDALSGIVYEDDSQIQDLHLYKAYDKEYPRLVIEVKKLEE